MFISYSIQRLYVNLLTILIYFSFSLYKKRRTKLSAKTSEVQQIKAESRAFTVIFSETLLNSHNALHEKDDWYRFDLLLLCLAVEPFVEIETQVPNSDFNWLSHGKVLSRLCGLCWPDIWKCLCKWWRECSSQCTMMVWFGRLAQWSKTLMWDDSCLAWAEQMGSFYKNSWNTAWNLIWRL